MTLPAPEMPVMSAPEGAVEKWVSVTILNE
jgi:hypothetical protein